MLGTIPGSLAAGFLLERYDTRSSMVAGAALTAGSLLFASQADSYLPFLISYFFAGFGVAMATLLPAAMVVANWFQAKRGMAMGVAIAGVSVGGMIMVQVAAAVIQAGGWRAAYTALALPVLLVVIPLVLLVVRTRPLEASVQGLSSRYRFAVTRWRSGMNSNPRFRWFGHTTADCWAACYLREGSRIETDRGKRQRRTTGCARRNERCAPRFHRRSQNPHDESHSAV